MKRCQNPICNKEFEPVSARSEYCSTKCRNSHYMKQYNKQGARRREALVKEPCPVCGVETNRWVRNEQRGKVCSACDKKLKAGKPIACPLYNEQGAMFHGKKWWIDRRIGKFQVVSIPFEPLCDGSYTDTRIIVKCNLGHQFDRPVSYLGSVCPICAINAKNGKNAFIKEELPERAGFDEWRDIWQKTTGIELLEAPASAWNQHTQMKVTARCWCGRVWETNWQDVCRKRMASCGCLTRFSQASEEILQLLEENGVTVSREHPLENLQIDMYVPDLKLAIEYNGLRWHRGEQDLKKFNLCNRYGMTYMGIFEDEWVYRKKSCIGVLLRQIGKFPADRRVISVEAIRSGRYVVRFDDKDKTTINEFVMKFSMDTLVKEVDGGVCFKEGEDVVAVWPFHKQDQNVIFEGRIVTDHQHFDGIRSDAFRTILGSINAAGYKIFLHSDNRLGIDDWCRSIGGMPFKDLPIETFYAVSDKRMKLDEDDDRCATLARISDCGHKLWKFSL